MTTRPYHLPSTSETDELLVMRNSGAAQRALDYYLKEDVSTPITDASFFDIKPGVSHEDALVHASDLLRSAAAAAYESASSRQGTQRDLAFSVVYLIDLAKAMVEQTLQVPVGQANT
ncbi:DUF6124 family protein [Pseudomonas antarctica]|uniref:DUF3077 domain-containing protein n=1 Tax=Pseudomonas antarctica TaxID=219572 RepID=A0A1G9ZLM7_9PSED|nr:DUF3077 domain-containing protein [Pseudomonas antarctica]KAF2411264.1 hypothetical protein PSAN_37080 [Pseudomonas antarctica]SDN21443.1 Protein of unknown function [Pseudomonas antarctica]